MVTRQQIEQFALQVAERYKPEKIILFGSQAHGTASKDSDVDILVIMPFEGRSVYKETEISATINPHFPLDLFVRRWSDIDTRIALGDCFYKDVMQGQVLYETAHETVAA